MGRWISIFATFEQEEKSQTDNPTIGLILCSDKNEAMVKYTLLNNNKRLFASRYKLYLPTEAELEREIEDERTKIEMEQKLLNPKSDTKRAR